MRTGPRILLIVVIAIVVFAVLVIATPLGWRVGMPLASRTVRQRTGLELSVGSVGGSPLSRLTLSDVSLDDPDAGPLFSASSLTAHYDLLSLRRGAPVVHELTVDDAVLTLDVGDGGALGGWERFASGDTTAIVEDGEPMEWTLDEAHLTGITIRYTNDAIGTAADVLLAEVEASGNQDELDIRLTAAGPVIHPTLTDTVHARLSAAGRLLADVVELESLALAAGAVRSSGTVEAQTGTAGEALELHASGILAISPEAELRLILDGRIDAAEALPLVTAASLVPAASGLLDVAGTLEGSWMDLEWTTVVTSPSVMVADIAAQTVALHAAGTADTITIDHVAFNAFGGGVEVRGLVALTGAVPLLRGSGHAGGIDVGQLPGSPVRGGADLAFEASMTAGDLTTLAAIVDAEGRGLRVEPDGEADAADIGDARIHVETKGGRFTGNLAARGAVAEFHGALTNAGVGSVTASAAVDDIAATLAGLADADVSGSLRAAFESDKPMDGLVFSASAQTESLRVGAVSIGTATVTAEGVPTDMRGRFSMFDGDAAGAWGFAGGDLSVDALLDSLAVAGGFELAPDRLLELAGNASGRVAFASATDGAFDLTAELAALSVESSGQNVRLTAPAVIEASRDSVRVRGLSLSGFAWLDETRWYRLARREDARRCRARQPQARVRHVARQLR